MIGLINPRQPNLQIRPAERKLNPMRIGSGRHDEIELQFARVAIVDYIDPRVHVVVTHASIIRHMRTPLARVLIEEVIAVTRQQPFRCGRCVPPATYQIHPAVSNRRAGRGERHAQAAAVCDEFGITEPWLETQPQAADVRRAP